MPTTYGGDSMPTGTGDDSLGNGYTEFTAENWPEWWGNYESNVPLAVDDPNEEPFDIDVYEQRTGDTSLRAYYAMQAMYLQMLNSGIDIFSMQTTSTVDPDESYYQPVEENVPPPADIVSEVTINVFNADPIVEGTGYAAFTIQVSSVGLGDAPISVIVSGRYRGSDGRNRKLSVKVLTFDLAHTERTVQIPMAQPAIRGGLFGNYERR